MMTRLSAKKTRSSDEKARVEVRRKGVEKFDSPQIGKFLGLPFYCLHNELSFDTNSLRNNHWRGNVLEMWVF